MPFSKTSFKPIRETLSDRGRQDRESCSAKKEDRPCKESHYLIWAPWKRVCRSERFLRTKNAELFLK